VSKALSAAASAVAGGLLLPQPAYAAVNTRKESRATSATECSNLNDRREFVSRGFMCCPPFFLV
jgi:hypothetical protein